MKRFLALFLAFVICLTFAGCSSDEYLKDATNKITIPIEVSKKYYYSVDVGDVINDDLRVGSLLFKGSFGSWHVEVTDKQIVENTTD